MYQIYNSITDEESSKLDYLSNICFKIHRNLIEFPQTSNPKEKEQGTNTTYNDKLYFRTLNKELDKENKLKSLEENNQINSLQKNKYFPFTEGVGIKTCLEQFGYKIRFITSNKINILEPKITSKKKLRKKFQIFDYSGNKKGILKKYRKRRFIPDDIRKKIKTKFHKTIKNIINSKLKSAGSIKLFVFFPQNFITNVTVQLNKLALNYTLEELIKTNIASDILKLKTSSVDLEKQRANLDVLNYLDRNPTICKLSSFNIIKKMKYKTLLKAYFISKEFEESIIELHKKREKDEYIERYINEALGYVHYFTNHKINPKNNKKQNKNIIQIIYDEEENDDKNEQDEEE